MLCDQLGKFMRLPERGDIVLFSTEDGLFIKRIVGLPGETVSVRHPHVYIDGEKIEGLPGMDRVAAMQPSVPGGTSYAGYHCTGDDVMPQTAGSLLHTPDQSLTLGDAFLPMGDNTLNSWDGRYWGGVPRT